MDEPLVNGTYLLHKFPGKGGWTYAEIPEIKPDPHAHFGWVRVKGNIDSYKLDKYHLMQLGNGNMFLPVNAKARKIIKKEAGDHVQVTLFADKTPTNIPAELIECLETEPGALNRFKALKETEQKDFIDWIYNARDEETKAERIAKTLALLQGQKTLRSK